MRWPRPSSRATTAQLARETTCDRILASCPSEKSGYRSYNSRATASSSTLSPRNSSRSYEDARSGAQDVCVKTCSSRSAGSSSIRLSRVALLVRGDVVDGLTDGRDLLCVIVRDLDPELVLELHDQLDEVERVRFEVLLKRRLFVDLVLVDAELLAQDFLHTLVDFLARSGHFTSLETSCRRGARMLTRRNRAARRAGRPFGAPPLALRGGLRSRSPSATSSRARSPRARAGRADRRRRTCRGRDARAGGAPPA